MIIVILYEINWFVVKILRVVVKNGECYWLDSIIEIIRMVYDIRINLYEEKKYRFMVLFVSFKRINVFLIVFFVLCRYMVFFGVCF